MIWNSNFETLAEALALMRNFLSMRSLSSPWLQSVQAYIADSEIVPNCMVALGLISILSF